MSKIRNYCLLSAAALALTIGSAAVASAHDWDHGCDRWGNADDGAQAVDADSNATPGIEVNPDDVNGPPPVHEGDDMRWMHHGMMRGDMDAPSSRALVDADMRMHHDMMVPFSGNPDRDFLAHMIPHHQGAVDMAEVELKYGTDPHVRELAKSIIASQRAEIDLMSDMLNKAGGPVPGGHNHPHHHHRHHAGKPVTKTGKTAPAPVAPPNGH